VGVGSQTRWTPAFIKDRTRQMVAQNDAEGAAEMWWYADE
jgi:hypothetical protein